MRLRRKASQSAPYRVRERFLAAAPARVQQVQKTARRSRASPAPSLPGRAAARTTQVRGCGSRRFQFCPRPRLKPPLSGSRTSSRDPRVRRSSAPGRGLRGRRVRSKGIRRLEAHAKCQAMGRSSCRDPARRLRTSRCPALTSRPSCPPCSLRPLGIRTPGSGAAAPDCLAPASWPRYDSSPLPRATIG